MDTPRPTQAWLAQVQHDLVKRLLWVARDCRDAGRQPLNGELVATLYDEEGQPIDGIALWERLRKQAPDGLQLGTFAMALEACLESARRNNLEGVLGLEAEFNRLRDAVASSLNKPGFVGTPTRKAH